MECLMESPMASLMESLADILEEADSLVVAPLDTSEEVDISEEVMLDSLAEK